QMISDIGRQPADLTRILVTHADLDHVGSLAAVQEATGAKIVASRRTADFLVQGKSPQHLPRLIQLIVNLLFKYKPVSADNIVTVADGETLPFLGDVQVIGSPGHTPDHISFYCPQTGVLFAGDALNTRHGRINPSPKRITADLDAAKNSAITLLGLAPAVLACGHGVPLTNHNSADLMAAFNAIRQE
ncbi:MAG: MBL fold metallo-hydrolase, partial [Chloroflexi bacterium]|nr:MBL fold metallo-hydrolase [Chloroflexota bacterium]